MDRCKACGGQGRVFGTSLKLEFCPICTGTGLVALDLFIPDESEKRLKAERACDIADGTIEVNK